MAGEYSPLKMAWHYIRDGGLPAVPKQVQVILSDTCSQDCVFCAYRMSGYTSAQHFADGPLSGYGHNNPKRQMATDRALRLVDEIARAGCLAIQFTGGGEPTVQKDHETIFQHALDAGLKCSLVSNGVKWSDRLRSEILPLFSWVRMSIDAGTSDTYMKIRRCPPGHWDLVLSNAASLASWIRSTKSSCIFGIGWVVTPGNFTELIEGVRIAKSTGAHNVRLSAMFSTDEDRPFRDIYDGIKADIDEARRRYEGDGFTINDLFGDRIEDLRQGAPDYKTCSYQHYTTYIGGDLKPYRCCVFAYNDRGMIAGGDLTDRAFDEFWASDERKADFEKFDARGCGHCQFNVKNRQMAYLLSDNPTHKEFP